MAQQSPFVCLSAHCRLLQYIGAQPNSFSVVTAASVRRRGASGIRFHLPPAHGAAASEESESPRVDVNYVEADGRVLFPTSGNPPVQSAMDAAADAFRQGFRGAKKETPKAQEGEGMSSAAPVPAEAATVGGSENTNEALSGGEHSGATSGGLHYFPSAVLRRTLLQALLTLTQPGCSPVADFMLSRHPDEEDGQESFAFCVLPTAAKAAASQLVKSRYHYVFADKQHQPPSSFCGKRSRDEGKDDEPIWCAQVSPRFSCVSVSKSQSSRVFYVSPWASHAALFDEVKREGHHQMDFFASKAKAISPCADGEDGDAAAAFITRHVLPSVFSMQSTSAPSSAQLVGFLQRRAFLVLSYAAHLTWCTFIVDTIVQSLHGDSARSASATSAFIVSLPSEERLAGGNHMWTTVVAISTDGSRSEAAGLLLVSVHGCQGSNMMWQYVGAGKDTTAGAASTIEELVQAVKK